MIDANDAAIGAFDGESINVLWSEESMVPRKHGKGGQSQMRFNRARKEALKQWLRKVKEILISEYLGQTIVVGGSGMTKEIFVQELPQNIQNSICDVKNVGYCDENGLWELVGKSRYMISTQKH